MCPLCDANSRLGLCPAVQSITLRLCPSLNICSLPWGQSIPLTHAIAVSSCPGHCISTPPLQRAGGAVPLTCASVTVLLSRPVLPPTHNLKGLKRW